MKESNKRKIVGGPSKEAFFKKNVMPINFGESYFWDLGAILANIEKDIKDEKLKDIIIIRNQEGKLKLTWRGTSPMTTGLGMLTWAEQQLPTECEEE